MKKVLFMLIMAMTFMSCHKSIEDRAARETKEFTEKQCPTPPVNNTRTDSVSFDKTTRTINNYYTLVKSADNPKSIAENKSRFHKIIIKALKDDTGLRSYKEAKFNFHFVYYSEHQKGMILYEDRVKPNEYQ